MRTERTFAVEVEVYVKARSVRTAVNAVERMMRTFESHHTSVPRVAVGGGYETEPEDTIDEVSA
jgi:hypothetical protein